MLKRCHTLWCVILFLILTFFAGSCPAASNENYSKDVDAVLNLYYKSLKAGDTESILDLLVGNALNHKEKILQSKDYSAFLRNYYANSKLNSIHLKKLNTNRMECNLEIRKGSNIIFIKLIISNMGNGWKITDEIIQ